MVLGRLFSPLLDEGTGSCVLSLKSFIGCTLANKPGLTFLHPHGGRLSPCFCGRLRMEWGLHPGLLLIYLNIRLVLSEYTPPTHTHSTPHVFLSVYFRVSPEFSNRQISIPQFSLFSTKWLLVNPFVSLPVNPFVSLPVNPLVSLPVNPLVSLPINSLMPCPRHISLLELLCVCVKQSNFSASPIRWSSTRNRVCLPEQLITTVFFSVAFLGKCFFMLKQALPEACDAVKKKSFHKKIKNPTHIAV